MDLKTLESKQAKRSETVFQVKMDLKKEKKTMKTSNSNEFAKPAKGRMGDVFFFSFLFHSELKKKSFDENI